MGLVLLFINVTKKSIFKFKEEVQRILNFVIKVEEEEVQREIEGSIWY